MNKIMLLFALILTLGIVQAVDVTVNNLDPVPAEAGKAVNVWFKVDNPDIENTEVDVEIVIDPQDGLELASGEDDTKKIGVLGPGASQIVQYRLFVQDDAFKGSHVVVAKITTSGTSFSKDLIIEVTDKDFKEIDLTVGDVESDPTRIKPDDDSVKIEVTILNLGDGRAQGVRAELGALPVGVTTSESYSGRALLGNIEPDSQATASFFLDIDKTVIPKEYNTNIEVTYKYKPDEEEDDFVSEQKMIPMRLAIKPIPLYEITKVQMLPEHLTAGDDDVRLTLTLTNIGEEEGESVRIKAFLKSEQPFSFNKASDFIAPSLKPGESGQGTFEFDIDDDANLQTYFLDVEIKNIVNDDIITFNEKVPVKVVNPLPDNPFSLVTIGIIVIVIVVVVMIVRGMLSRRKKPKAKKIEGSQGKSHLDKIQR